MDTTKQNAKQAVALTTILTLFVAGFELLIAFTKYRTGMNFLDLTTYVTQNKYIYFMLLMIANLALFPAAFLLFKTNGISLKNEICSKKTLVKDILYGIIALAGTEIVGLVSILADKGKTEMAYVMTKPSAEIIILWFISLGLVSGIIKEIFFRGLARFFLCRFRDGFLVENATERCLSFRKRYPDLSGRVAQRHIATYLGIAPETLSRIRNSLKE